MAKQKLSIIRFLVQLVAIIVAFFFLIFLINFFNLECSSSSKKEAIMRSLITGLQDRNTHVKAASAQALGKLGDKRAANALVAAIEQDSLIFDVVIDALNKLDIDLDYSDLDAMPEEFEFSTGEKLRLGIRNYFNTLSSTAATIAQILAVLIVIGITHLLFRWLEKKIHLIDLVVFAFTGGSKNARRRVIYSINGVLTCTVIIVTYIYLSWFLKESVKLHEVSEYQSKRVKIEMAGARKEISAIPMLIKILNDDELSYKLRWRAAYSLGRIGHEGAQNILMKTMRDRNRRVRQYSAWALGNIHASNENDKQDEATPLVRRFCPHCGEKITPTDTYCGNCKKEIEKIFVEKPEKE